MSLASRIRAFLAPPIPTPAGMSPVRMEDAQLAIRSVIRASYDAAARTPENTRHWQWADHRSADSAMVPSVRRSLRSQSRYELNENNSYGDGLAKTIITDTIGTGPRLQVSMFSSSINQQIEQSWQYWCLATGFNDKLDTYRRSRLVDGESVMRFINNINVEDPVQLDLQMIECDQLSSPYFHEEMQENYVDGVRLDRFGNPYAYDLLRHHPGNDYYSGTDPYAFDTYSHSQIIHQFQVHRPGQHRGVPEVTPALPLFAFLRRFTLATVSAAETAASVSQVITTDAPIPEELEDEYSAATFDKVMDTISIDRNSATVLPNQWKLQQFAAEHPTTTYKMFKRELLAEIGRCLCVPVNIAAGDSGESNYSSARFDWLGYERSIKKDQAAIGRKVLDRVLGEWLIEAALVGAIPLRAASWVLTNEQKFGRGGLVNRMEHSWYWDGLRDADAQNAANATKVRLQTGTTQRAREYAEQGLDIEIEDTKAAASFGLSVQEYRESVAAAVFSNGNFQASQRDPQNDTQQTTPESADATQAAT